MHRHGSAWRCGTCTQRMARMNHCPLAGYAPADEVLWTVHGDGAPVNLHECPGAASSVDAVVASKLLALNVQPHGAREAESVLLWQRLQAAYAADNRGPDE